MSVRLNGSTSGYTELDAGAVAGNNTIKLPTGNGSAYQVLRNGATPGTLELADKIVSETAKAYNWNGLTNNTSIDFTGIPSWAKRITVLFDGLGTASTGSVVVQLGTSSGIEESNYIQATQTGTTLTGYSTGFAIDVGGTTQAATVRSGELCISLVGGNTWVSSGNVYSAGGTFNCVTCAGKKTLAGTLTRVRITILQGGDFFDAGSVNIFYE